MTSLEHHKKEWDKSIKMQQDAANSMGHNPSHSQPQFFMGGQKEGTRIH